MPLLGLPGVWSTLVSPHTGIGLLGATYYQSIAPIHGLDVYEHIWHNPSDEPHVPLAAPADHRAGVAKSSRSRYALREPVSTKWSKIERTLSRS